jgi:hypothetical protein
MHVATIRVDIWWVASVTATEKHISTPSVPAFPLSVTRAETVAKWSTLVSQVLSRYLFRNQLCNSI